MAQLALRIQEAFVIIIIVIIIVIIIIIIIIINVIIIIVIIIIVIIIFTACSENSDVTEIDCEEVVEILDNEDGHRSNYIRTQF